MREGPGKIAVLTTYASQLQKYTCEHSSSRLGTSSRLGDRRSQSQMFGSFGVTLGSHWAYSLRLASTASSRNSKRVLNSGQGPMHNAMDRVCHRHETQSLSRQISVNVHHTELHLSYDHCVAWLLCLPKAIATTTTAETTTAAAAAAASLFT